MIRGLCCLLVSHARRQWGRRIAACLVVWQAAGPGCIGLGLVRLGWAELARIAVMVTGDFGDVCVVCKLGSESRNL